MNDQLDLFFKKVATKEQFDAWFLGSNFTRGNVKSNIEILKSIFKGYSLYASQQIRNAKIPENEKNFELQKLNLLSNIFENTCSSFSEDGIHGLENNFLYFIIGYANTLGNQHCNPEI